MNLIKLDNLQLAYGEQVIFDQLNIQAKRGDRICLVGRNGVGKSTLLKTISGEVDVDGGQVWRSPTAKLATLSQDLPEESDISVFDFVAGGLAQLGKDLARYAELSTKVDEKSLEEMGEIQVRIEAVDGWTAHNRIEQILTRLDLDGESRLGSLSGGWRRRVALAQALVCEPDVLLLDEPTNHLDIVSIEWLEKQLLEFQGAIIFVTHDRTFLRNVANKIGEIDRGQMTVWDGDYASFLVFREQQLADEEKRNSEFDKKLAQEEVWIRQGIKARRTRNEGRVRALKQLRQERSERRDRLGNVKMEVTTDTASGKIIAELKNVSFGWEGTPIISNFSANIIRGDKIGLIGPNGIGKSTFLKLLLKDIEPQSGDVKIGSNLSIAYFDQLRDQLNLELNAVDNIAEGREFIDINGKPKHVISYLNDFMFTGERARTPIKALSGGERNRILLAKLFSKPANCLIMDEPTNDLDAETLDLLEDLLLNYEGTLFLVSHDREFLDNVVTSTIGFEGRGVLKEYVGGYKDWQRQGGVWYQGEGGSTSAKAEDVGAVKVPIKKVQTAKKMPYKLQKELDSLPAKLEKLETSIAKLQEEVCVPGFYDGPAEQVDATTALIVEQEKQLQACYGRWEELEAMQE